MLLTILSNTRIRFSGISNNWNGFITSEIAPYVYFLRHGDKRSAACYVHNDVSKFPVTATVLQHLRLHKWFTFSAHGESPGVAGDRGKLE